MGNPKDVRTLFDEALELPAEQRNAFLRRACAGDLELFENLIGLVRAHSEATGAPGTHAQVPESLLASIQRDGLPSDSLGPYRLVRKIGEGGMGMVYLGLRSDDAFRKIVAIKVMREDRASEEFGRRFKQERQVLASLDHPNIARILDGGTTEDGLLYYVMDYVDGKRIDTYCNESKAGVADRIKLFQQICLAVDYLHENLIVHRDLKPSNILVTADGVVKLLDFGIAKVQTPGPNQTINFGSGPTRLMTPDYASPEQMCGETVTRSSDIYSLGVILYELLTGRQPFPHSDVGPGVEARLVPNVEPPKPSTNIRDDLKHTPDTTQQLKRRLAGDLDTIVLMALRRTPGSRYATAKDFADDLQNYLDGKSVKARRETVARRTVKLVRRNPLRAAVGLAVLLLLVFGVWQTAQAYTQRVRADAMEGEIARLIDVLARRMDEWPPASTVPDGRRYLPVDEQVRDVRQMTRILQDDFSSLLALRPGRTPRRDALVQQAVQYLGQAEQRARASSVVVREVAHGYLSAANLQSRPANVEGPRGLGDDAGAISNYRNSGLLLMDVARQEPQDTGLQKDIDFVRTQLVALGASALPSVVTPAPGPVPEPPPAPIKTVASGNSRRNEAAASQGTAAPPAPQQNPPPQPQAPAVSAADLNDAIQRVVNVEARVQSAGLLVSEWHQNLANQGLSLRPDISAAATRMTSNLELARKELEQRNLEAVQTYLNRAEADATRVLRFFGR